LTLHSKFFQKEHFYFTDHYNEMTLLSRTTLTNNAKTVWRICSSFESRDMQIEWYPRMCDQ